MVKAFRDGNVLWLFVTIISLLCVGGLLFFMFQEQAKRIDAERRLIESEKAKKAVEIELDQSQLELIQLKDQAQTLTKQLEQKENNYQLIRAEAAQKDSQIRSLEKELSKSQAERKSLVASITELKGSFLVSKAQLEQEQAKVKELEKRLAGFTGKPGVELKKIVVTPKRSLQGKVLVVNRKFHFIVIDLGKQQGVNPGDEFVVYQDTQEVGKVQLEKVYESMSSATILAGSQEEKITETSIVQSF